MSPKEIKNNVWVFDNISPELLKSRLPSIKSVLKVHLYNILIEKNSAKKSSSIVAKKVMHLWNSIGLPCIKKDKIILKLKQIHQQYVLLKKNKSRKKGNQNKKVTEFKRMVRNLFDVAPQKWDSSVSDKLERFLEDQRTDRKLQFNYIRDATVVEQIVSAKKKVNNDEEYDSMTEDSSESEDKDDDTDFTVDMSKCESIQDPNTTTDPTILMNNILKAPIVTSAIDRAGISSEQFKLIMAPMAVVAKADPSKTRISQSTIKRRRERNRFYVAQTIKNNFVSQASLKKFVLHWDGKLLADMINPDHASKKRKVDRIAVAVSGDETSKLLGIPRVDSGTGYMMADAVYNEIEKWELTKNVVGMCCDTTSSNTGNKNGAAALLQSAFFKEELIFFPCRHHIHEIVSAAVFLDVFGPSSGPYIDIFVDFRDNWNKIRIKTDLQSLPELYFHSTTTKRLRTETITCLQGILADVSGYIPRDDYRELIDLTLIILGVRNSSYKLKIPGALHHARWMCKVIYCFKLYLLRKQLRIAPEFYEVLENFCLFCALIYVKQWIVCPLLIDAAVNDLQLFKNLMAYTHINHQIAHTALNKINGHLWYLGPELAAFALFSDKVSVSEKQVMIHKMKKCDAHWQRSLNPKYDKLHLKGISDLITSRSLFSLNKLNSTTFKFMLHNDPTVWTTNQGFKKLRHIVSKLNVVNDVVERAIARITKYNSSLMYDEEEKHRVLQIVEYHCSRFSRKTKKEDLLKQ